MDNYKKWEYQKQLNYMKEQMEILNITTGVNMKVGKKQFTMLNNLNKPKEMKESKYNILFLNQKTVGFYQYQDLFYTLIGGLK